MGRDLAMKAKVLIVGAGVIGSALAQALARRGVSNIVVIDADLEGVHSSSELNAGGVRATWYQDINVLLSRQTIDYLKSVSDEVGYRACGYLWMYRRDRWDAARAGLAPHRHAQWPVQEWTPDELKKRVPFIDKADDLAGALFAERDGLVNPNLLKKKYRADARARGVEFWDQTLLKSIEGKTARLVTLPESAPPSDRLRALGGEALSAGMVQEKVLQADVMVNCAGPWAPRVAQALGYHCPSQPVRRQVCIFESRQVDLTPYGMMVDPSGVYFHPEAHQGLAGYAQPGEKAGYNFEYDGEAFFQETVWPALYERSTGFEALKHVTGWAGLYEVSPDESAIVGRVGGGPNYEAHSFSGHGVMQSYAVGERLAERILQEALGAAPSPWASEFDPKPLEVLSADRFARGRLIHESLVI